MRKKIQKRKVETGMKKIPYRKAAVLIAVLLGVCAGILSYTEVFSKTDRRVTDWVYDHAKQQEADSRITILAVDEKSTEAYGEQDTWSRSIYADAIEKLTAEQAAVVGLDLDLTESGNDDGDAALEEACSKAGNVVAAASAVFEDDGKNKKPESETEEPQEKAEEVSAVRQNSRMFLHRQMRPSAGATRK